MLERNVADGVHRLEHAFVNCYIVEDDDGVTIVDAGLPDHWYHLGRALRQLGRWRGDVRGVVLTHAHFDHVGAARRMQERLEVPIYLHPSDQHLAAHPYSYAHENPRAAYPIRHPKAIPVLTSMALAGALRVKGVADTVRLKPNSTLPLPGRPSVIFTPGHTYGHCALHLPDRNAVITGDALVTLDPYTAETGPRIVSGAATADSEMNLRSLDALAAVGARHVLPGHGEVWHQGVAAAVAHARAVGPA